MASQLPLHLQLLAMLESKAKIAPRGAKIVLWDANSRPICNF